MKSHLYQRGFTLIELIIVMVLLAIVTAIAAPSFSQMINSSQRSATVSDLTGLLTFARSESVQRGETVEIFPEGDAFGARMAADSSDVIRVMDAVSDNMTVSRLDASANNLRFNATGRASETARFRVCGESGTDGIRINVNAGGQVRQEDSNENTGDLSCP